MVKFLLINEIGAAIVDALRTFLGFLCKIIYPLIIDAWDLFIALSKAQIFNSEGDGIVNDMYTKVGLVLGLFMLFRVIFSLFQMFLNPDTLTDKEKGIGSIVKRAMVVIILLAMTPKIFGWAFQLQEIVIDDGVIAKFILGTDPSDQNVKKFGSALSLNLFRNFYVLDSYNEEAAFNECQTFKLTYAELYDYGTLDLIDQCLTTKYDAGKIAASEEAQQEFNISADIDEDYERYAINFTLNGVLAVVAGIGVLYIIITYCVYLGARVIQLAFLQIIAPIPIISYLTPQKDNGLSKWAKICISTYIDAFIRIALVYFVALIISNIISEGQEGLDNLIASTDITKDNPLYAYLLIFIILGLLMVAKKVPDLLGEIFPSLGAGKGKLGFGLSWKKMTDNMLGWKAITGATKMATGAATGAAIGFAGGRGVGRLTGIVGGVGRGVASGFKKGGVIKNIGDVARAQSKRNAQKIDWRDSGSTMTGRFAQRMANTFGLKGSAEVFENQIKQNQKEIDNRKTLQESYKRLSGYKKSMEERAESKLLTGVFDPTNDMHAYNLQRRLLQADARVKSAESALASAKNSAPSLAEINKLEKDLANARSSGAPQTEISKFELALTNAKALRKSADENIRNLEDNLVKVKMDYNNTLDQSKKEYITAALNNDISDGRIVSLSEDMTSTVRANPGAFDNIDFVPTDFDVIDKVEKEASSRTSELDREIETYNVANANIKNSEEYKRATADRNAVGGHKGGK